MMQNSFVLIATKFCESRRIIARIGSNNTCHDAKRIYPTINSSIELRRAREIRLFLVADKGRRVCARTGSVLSKYVCRSSSNRFTFTRAFNISERRWEIHIHSWPRTCDSRRNECAGNRQSETVTCTSRSRVFVKILIGCLLRSVHNFCYYRVQTLSLLQ